MNPPDPSGPDGRLPRLAGFADGELDERAAKRVAEWVETDPEAAELLRDQEQLAPANTEFWATVAPPWPDEAAWEAVRRSVADQLTPAVPPPSPWSARDFRTLFATAAGVALAILVGWLAFDRPRPPAEATIQPQVVHSAPARGDDPLAEFAAIELAGPRDVLIEAVSGEAPDAGFAADSPACDSMPLAEPGDVTLVVVRPGPRGERPSCGLCPRTGDAPMIYAAGPRTR